MKHTSSEYGKALKALTALQKENKELMDVNIYEHSVAQKAEAKIEQALDIADKIAGWCAAYPVDIFTEPTKAEWKIANEVLKEAGISMTAMSASNMRHVVNGMKAYAEELQAVLQEPVSTTNSAQISRKLVDEVVTCTHRRIEPGSYADTWKTDCGQTYQIEGPIEVGMGFNPDPSGNFCSNCGKKLVVDRHPKSPVEKLYE